MAGSAVSGAGGTGNRRPTGPVQQHRSTGSRRLLPAHRDDGCKGGSKRGRNNQWIMQDIRCGQCNRLLAKGEALDLSIKCPRCGAINHVRAASPDTESHRAPEKGPSRARDAL